MNDALATALEALPDYLGHHVVLSAAALALGMVLAVPLAIAASRSAAVRWPAMTFVSLVQTVPSLALMALFYPILLALGAASAALLGWRFSALGFLPALIALTLYSMQPIIRNIVTGIAGLDPAIIEAAQGVGMTRRQQLWRVELPLVAPIAMAGVRTSAVWVIGTATLATPVGQTSLGNYIFSGLQTENWVWVLFGCGVSAALALVVDQLLALIQFGVSRRSRPHTAAGAALLAAAVMVAAFATGQAPQQAYVIGAKNFSEQYILSALMRARLEAGGHPTSQRDGLGSAVIFRALADGDIDAYVDYSGTIWTNVMHRTDTPPREEMLRIMKDWLAREHGVRLLGALGFENAYALAMRADRAEALGIETIGDLAPRAPQMAIGGDYEFFVRPEWRALREGYGLTFSATRQYQSTFMYRALTSGDVDVISAFSSDGRIAANHLKVLSDPLGRIPPYDAIVLIAPGRANDPILVDALQPLVGHIPVSAMREANYLVDRPDGAMTPQAAAAWLDAHITAAPEH